MDYRVCEADALKKLERKVNRLLGEGWRPAGGVSVVQSVHHHWWFYQALTREGPDPGGLVAPVKPAPGDLE